MKIAGFFLLLAGWLLVLAALAMLPPGVNHAAARNGFILAGLAVELTGLVIVVRMHIAPSDRA